MENEPNKNAEQVIGKLAAHKSQADRLFEYLQTSMDAPDVKVSRVIECWAEWNKIVGG